MKKIFALALVATTLLCQPVFATDSASHTDVLPIRQTATKLGYTVQWDAQTQSVVIKTPEKEVTVFTNEPYYIQNNTLYCELESKLQRINDQLYAPYSFWQDALQVSITKEDGKLVITDKPSPNDLLDDIIMPLQEGENTYYVNQKLGLSLEENPSTGYVWTLDVPFGIQIISDNFTPADTHLVGAPGTRSWMLRAVQPGTYTLTFKKVRPFDSSQAAETKTYILHANVFEIPKQ